MSRSWRWMALLGVALVIVLARCAVRSSSGPHGEEQPGSLPRSALHSDRNDWQVQEVVAPEREPTRTNRHSLQGRVISSDGEALEGAVVRWLALQTEDTELTPAWPVPGWGVPPRVEVTTRTDPEGVFRFDQPPGAQLPFGSVLVVTHASHSPGGFDLTQDTSSWPAEILVELRPTTPVAIHVVDASGKGQAGALVRQVTGGVRATLHGRFVVQEARTDEEGQTVLASLEGEQTFWAEFGERVSLPWQGRNPKSVTLRLGESFTLGGGITLPDWSTWDQNYEGERRILVAGQAGNLWRPLLNLRDVGPGDWGPVAVPLEGMRRIRVRLEGIPILPQEVEFPSPPAGTHRRVDFVAEMGAALDLIVQDEEGQPITNARAKAWWSTKETVSGGNYLQSSSRPDGRIHLSSVRPGTVVFRVSAPGFAFVEGDTIAPNALPVILMKGGGIVGRCLHRGQPVQDFQVMFWQAGPVPIHREATFLGRDEGSFELEDLQAGEWWVLAASPTHPGSDPVLVEVPPEKVAQVELDLPIPIRGKGMVVDHQTGQPVPDATIQVFSAGANGPGLSWGLPVPVARDGSFDLEAFVLGANYLTAQADGYASTDVSATADSMEFLDWGEIRLPRPQPLRISLLGLESLQGKKPGDLRATSTEGLEEKRFDAEGQVLYEHVRPGDHELLVLYPDNTWARLRLRLDVGSDWNVDFKVAGGRALTVRVLDEEGEPVPPSTSILLAAQEENGVFVVRLKQPIEDGLVRFEGIRAPRGQVFVMADNEFLTSRDLDLSSEGQEVEIRLGDTPFRVRVVDREGNPVPGAWLSIRTSPGDGFVGIADTGIDGWASFKGLPSGGLLLNVGHPEVGTRYGVPIEAAAKELEFVLEASGSLELRLVDGTDPLAGVATRIETAGGVTLADARETGSDGVVRYELLGEGQYRLGCRRADCWPAYVEETLSPDEHASLAVQMRRLADLELYFVSRDGLLVSGVNVALDSLEFGVPVATWLAEGRVQSAGGLITDSSGRIRVERLPRGAYQWSVYFEGKSLSGMLELAPAESNVRRVLLP